MQIQFFKYEGAGNDFIMIDNRNNSFSPSTNTIHKLCDRHFSVGADGLILLEKHSQHSFSMRYYNADGKEGTMCGNGGRCIVWFAKSLGLFHEEVSFMAIDGEHQAILISENSREATVKLQMQNISQIENIDQSCFLDSGSPHLIKWVDDPDQTAIFEEGRKIRYSPEYKSEGVNINFACLTPAGIKIRTYERGVENETLACGTGAVATAVAAMQQNPELQSPVLVEARGGQLKVYASKKGDRFIDIWLEGPARFVFKGSIEL